MHPRRLCPYLPAFAVAVAVAVAVTLALPASLTLAGCGSATSPAAQVRSAQTLFDLSRDARQKLAAAKLVSVHVSGDAATTTDTTGPPANRWVKVDGGWQLADLDLGS
jgi:hypothetical protein